MKTVKEFRDQTPEELNAIMGEKRKELFELVNKLAREKKIERPHHVRSLKKDIARIMTVLREKALAK